MNRDNLLKMAVHIMSVPQSKFDMSRYRRNYVDDYHECESVGCVIGHCTILDKENDLPRGGISGVALFGVWSERFTGLKALSPEWNWCFSMKWKRVDNTPIGASKRIMILLMYGLPKDWKEQMLGISPLSYDNSVSATQMNSNKLLLNQYNK